MEKVESTGQQFYYSPTGKMQLRTINAIHYKKQTRRGERGEGRVEGERHEIKEKEKSSKRYLIILQFDMCNNQLEGSSNEVKCISIFKFVSTQNNHC